MAQSGNGLVNQTIGPNEDKCPLCGQQIEDKCQIEVCGHWFCFGCLNQWKYDCPNPIKTYCPVCENHFTLIRCNFISEDNFFRHSIHSFSLYNLIEDQVLRAQRDCIQNMQKLLEEFQRKIEKLSEMKGRLDSIQRVNTNRDHLVFTSIEDILKELLSLERRDRLPVPTNQTVLRMRIDDNSKGMTALAVKVLVDFIDSIIGLWSDLERERIRRIFGRQTSGRFGQWLFTIGMGTGVFVWLYYRQALIHHRY